MHQLSILPILPEALLPLQAQPAMAEQAVMAVQATPLESAAMAAMAEPIMPVLSLDGIHQPHPIVMAQER